MLHHAVHFLCIGAQKAGTTWLWHMLRMHPRVWLTPLKELHYFDRSLRYASANLLAADRLFDRLFNRAPHNREFRRSCRAQLGRAIAQRDWPLAHWYARYYLGGRDDNWYLSLFSEGRGKVRGEITPAYSMLDAQDVGRVQRLLPDARIIFLLRNPIERAWSHIRFEWMEGRFAGINNAAQIRELIEHPGLTIRGDYLRTLAIWESKFPRDQIFVGFYDDIVEQPAHLLLRIFGFLGLEAQSQGNGRTIRHHTKVHASKELAIPPEIRVYLARKYLQDLEQLTLRFGGHAQRWHADALAALRQ